MRCAPATTLLVAGCVAMALAGCAATGAGTGPVTASSRTAVAAAPRKRAVADASALLRAFAVPPGARRLRQAPEALKVPITTLGSTSQVDDVSFWRAPGRPQAVLAWEEAHLSRRFTLGDADFGPPSWDRMFSLPPVPGVLSVRELVVEVTGAGNGQTAIRVDARVSWQPARPVAERVPSVARVVTITLLPGLGPVRSRPPAPVTIANLAVVRRLAALVDDLQLSVIPPDAPCPLQTGSVIRLAFLARPGSPPLAVAQGPAACGTVQFSVGGKRQPALQLTDSFIPQVRKAARLRAVADWPRLAGIPGRRLVGAWRERRDLVAQVAGGIAAEVVQEAVRLTGEPQPLLLDLPALAALGYQVQRAAGRDARADVAGDVGVVAADQLGVRAHPHTEQRQRNEVDAQAEQHQHVRLARQYPGNPLQHPVDE